MPASASPILKAPKALSHTSARMDVPVRERNPAANLHLIGTTISYARNTEIFGEGEAAEYIYKVVSGAVRTHRILDDGRRQIGAFYLPGDVFGLEAGDAHRFTAEAVANCSLVLTKRSWLIALAAQRSDVAHSLWALTVRELEHVQDVMLMLCRKNAVQRLAAFLLDMETRHESGKEIELPMPRQDIADYLGLTIETVSRTFTQLENDSAIELPTSRRVILRNREALQRLNS